MLNVKEVVGGERVSRCQKLRRALKNDIKEQSVGKTKRDDDSKRTEKWKESSMRENVHISN